MKLTTKIENACLNPDLKKRDVRRLLKAGVLSGEITPEDKIEVERILSDRDMCADDALGELRLYAYYREELTGKRWAERMLEDSRVLSFVEACMNAAKA